MSRGLPSPGCKTSTTFTMLHTFQPPKCCDWKVLFQFFLVSHFAVHLRTDAEHCPHAIFLLQSKATRQEWKAAEQYLFTQLQCIFIRWLSWGYCSCCEAAASFWLSTALKVHTPLWCSTLHYNMLLGGLVISQKGDSAGVIGIIIRIPVTHRNIHVAQTTFQRHWQCFTINAPVYSNPGREEELNRKGIRQEHCFLWGEGNHSLGIHTVPYQIIQQLQ